MILVGTKHDFKVFFDCGSQSYSVYKNGQFLIGNKYKFSEVKTYLS